MVFCGLYPVDGDDFADLRDALEKLRLNDASFTYEPETSGALGFGFRCGFLGLLHMEIVRERLEREFDLSLIATAPSVEYLAHLTNGKVIEVDNPSAMPDGSELDHIEEPFLTITILLPGRVHRHGDGPVPDPAGRDGEDGVPVARAARARLPHPAGRGRDRLLRPAEEPHQGLRQPRLRSRPATSGSDLVKVDVLLNGVPVDAFSTVVHKSKADDYGRKMAEKLRELIPRQMFDVPIQAAIGGRVIARETVKAKRKDVLAKCYGGDITRKRKLLEKQKEGKKRMKNIGRVEVPQEAFIMAATQANSPHCGGGSAGAEAGLTAPARPRRPSAPLPPAAGGSPPGRAPSCRPPPP